MHIFDDSDLFDFYTHHEVMCIAIVVCNVAAIFFYLHLGSVVAGGYTLPLSDEEYEVLSSVSHRYSVLAYHLLIETGMIITILLKEVYLSKHFNSWHRKPKRFSGAFASRILVRVVFMGSTLLITVCIRDIFFEGVSTVVGLVGLVGLVGWVGWVEWCCVGEEKGRAFIFQRIIEQQ